MFLYPDQGYLTYLAKNQKFAQAHLDKGVRFAYSEATLKELKRSKYCCRELDFLKNYNALFLANPDGDGIGFHASDPKRDFESVDDLSEVMIGGLFSRIVGGGPDVSDDQFLIELISKVPFIDEPMAQAMVKKREFDEAIVSKNDFVGAFQRTPRMKEKESLSDFIEGQGEIERAALSQVFPSSMPENADSRAMVSLMLNYVVPRPAKKIGGIKTKAAENEVFDAFHIAYALECHLFVTTDVSTARKYKILSDYWGLNRHSIMMKKGAPQGAL